MCVCVCVCVCTTKDYCYAECERCGYTNLTNHYLALFLPRGVELSSSELTYRFRISGLGLKALGCTGRKWRSPCRY